MPVRCGVLALTYPDDEDALAAAAPRVRHDRPRRAPGGVRADPRPVTWDERQRALATRLAGRPLTALEQGTLVVIPSTTFPSVELRKITGIEHYEERMLFTAAPAAPARAAGRVRHRSAVDGAVDRVLPPSPPRPRRRAAAPPSRVGRRSRAACPEREAAGAARRARGDPGERGRRVVGLRAAVQRHAARASGERRAGSARVRRVARALRVWVRRPARVGWRAGPVSPSSTAPKGSARSTRSSRGHRAARAATATRAPSWSS